MTLNEGKRVASLVREDLDRLHKHVAELIGVVGGSIGTAISARIDEPLASVKNHLAPLLDLLARVEGTPKRGPGRPRRTAVPGSPAPKRRRRRGGGRGRKANLTAEQIQEALKQANGIKARAARLLSVSSMTFEKYLKATSAPEPTKRGRPSPKK